MSQSGLRPILLSHGSMELTSLIPTSLYFNYTQLKDQFTKALPESTDGFAGDDEPSSPVELVAQFLGYVASLVDRNASTPGQFDEVLKFTLQEFEARFLNGQDIHNLAAKLLADEQYPTSLAKVKSVIKNYVSAIVNSNTAAAKVETALFSAATKGDATIVALFGGQGNTEDYFEELRELNQTYGDLTSDIIAMAADKLQSLVRATEGSHKIYTQGIDIKNWLAQPEQTPDQSYLLSIPVSCPVICLIQLVHYAVTARVLGLTPGDLRSYLSGATGHSQGVVTAVAIASSDSWESYFENASKAISLFFYIGLRSIQAHPHTSLPPSMVQDSLENGEGKPSHMLSIRDLSRDQVSTFIAETNKHLPEDKRVSISLVNGARNFVLSGYPQSLYGLNVNLRKHKAPAGLEQARVPFSERKMKFTNRFLPITSPFHCHLLAPAYPVIIADIEGASLEFEASKLAIPVYDTFDGSNLQKMTTSISARLVRMIIELAVNWEKATAFKSTHMLEFGPGGVSGLGVLTHRNKDGTGSRVILAGTLDSTSADDEYGFKQEIFDRNSTSLKYASNWLNEYKPRLVKTSAGKVYVDTKFSQLLGRAPLMVPGMTPTTVSPDFVAATLNAGYHIEIAGGGYFTSGHMTKALEEVASQIPPGAGIGINMIYVNPRMLQWGIPMVKELRDKGFPIQSMSIGAGVPSMEVASEYIETLGLTHLGLKPGSVDAIAQCIAIAKAHPTFPIVVQWTGGRGGGHHSFEDFHQPILQMYSKMRKCSNIVLIAGSGFGSDADTYPYLTGEWSGAYNYPPMPFDGVLFGSRVMTALEAKTSPAAKLAIVGCTGVPDSLWEQSYKKPTGGIITVRSEMGEPIHKIATRGVMLWQEMDNTIFNLPKGKLVETLNKKKDYIIKKLNADFQKPWFGKNALGPCDLQDMTYAEVAQRLVELMYIRKSARWIDVSLRAFTGDFLRRVEERFATSSGALSLLQNFQQLENPDKVLEAIFEAYPLAREQLINEQDCDFFLIACMNPIQKPVPFVPILDERFEIFFKKDSLWQSEDLEAVVDEDVQRTCILHGPVAAQFTNKADEPIKEILDSIHNGHIQRLLKDVYNGDESSIPVVEYFGPNVVSSVTSVAGVTVEESAAKVVYKTGTTIPEAGEWFKLLAGNTLNWRHAFFSTKRVIQGVNHGTNPLHAVFAPAKNVSIEVAAGVVTLFESLQGKIQPVAELKALNATTLQLSLIEHRTADGKPVSLPFLYTYNPADGFAPILEVLDARNDRIKEFYWKLWFGSDVPVDLDIDAQQTIQGDETAITVKDIAEFTHAIGNKCEAFVHREGKATLAPMDFAIVAGWKAIMKAIFPKSVDGDLLRLVHLSNGYKMLPGAEPLKAGDVVKTSSEIRAVINQESGKMVEVVGTITREGLAVMEVTSQFLYRGVYVDFENTFRKTTETPVQITLKSAKDVAVLQAKEWFHLEEDCDLLNKTLTFRCESAVTYKNQTVFASVKTTGQVLLELPTSEIVQIASVEYEAADSHGNPVTDYLNRIGSTIEQPIMLENAIPLSSGEDMQSKAPGTNEPYAAVSGDYNPIHVSRVFAAYANLPGTITHGMYNSAAVRGLVEQWAADNVAPRVRAFKCSFVGMVLPNDLLETRLEHVGMINGRKIIKVETINVETQSPVLVGEAEIDQPVSTFVFTGQGSQEQGMGMDLYESSPVAREVWDRADRHFMNTYGFSIISIVKDNPNELTIHFGGPKGRAIRENYISMMFESVAADGSLKSEKIFKEITEESTCFTFRSPTGLLSATQFTQPALTLMEKASFDDLQAKSLVPEHSMFAGHSLGEYSALASLGNVMPIESLVEVVFYRGMTMQVAVPRDEEGRSNYGMCAVNPSRISATFNDAALRWVVDHIAEQTGWLLEIVNYNVENTQYVTAGDLRALDTLTNVLNVFKLQKIDIVKLQELMPLEKVKEHLSEIVEEVSKKSSAKPQPVDLERGFAVIPLKGISVPFHSSYLRSGVKPFQRFLVKKIPQEAIKPSNLINKYIPNLTAKPFEITKEYFQDVYELTGSEKIKNILDNWEKYENA
ncbi:hypothetical protein BABINDRAFT_78539 [Babjeviella inositovora NRRL Y-12698]|uniref:Fatty acid synthase subunit beta n=1 Tax=Babjeviella inositovora NRRL Y-12698 TaxID=984486 RepID=A0A1E3QZG3_9ASCO|nr:uncharacterized protein BABINDRAFT_78539 [Babjeviella inositovora NRRL Y-12698]ODQ82934.1 hypothetical protein BABINDRAFT_78539 [Babjeviella inositovora NRRL Y-12698]